MDKYDLFLRDIIDKTESGLVLWENIPPTRYAEYIFQSTYAFQGYECEYSTNLRTYKLVFVNKKVPYYHDDWDLVVDKHYCEVLVLLNGVLLITLNDDYVNEEDLFRLGLLIEEKNPRTKELFEQFEVQLSGDPDPG